MKASSSKIFVAVFLIACARISLADTVWGCTGGDDDALAGTASCSSEGSACPSAGFTSHTSASLVSTWVDSGGGYGVGDNPVCGASGGSWVWRKVSAMSSGDLVYTNEGYLVTPESLGYTISGGGGGDTGGSGGSTWDPPNWTASQWGEIVSALIGTLAACFFIRQLVKVAT